MGVFVLITVCLIVLVLGCIEIGRRIRLLDKDGKTSAGLGVIDGAVFGLLGLLLAFAFAGADSRFQARRQLIVQETNAIGTAYLRVDLLPDAAQPQIRQDFRDYVDKRIAFYKDLTDNPEQSKAEFAEANALQQKIWTES